MVSSVADGISAFDVFPGERDYYALPDVPNLEIGTDSADPEWLKYFKAIGSSSGAQEPLAMGVGSSGKQGPIPVCDPSSDLRQPVDALSFPDVRSDRDRTTINQRLQKDTPTGRRSNCSRKARSKDYSQEEKNGFLELWDAHTPRFKGQKLWSSIARGMKERGHNRGRRSCEYLAGTLQKTFKTIKDINYYDMSVGERTSNKLPKQFPQEWYETLKRILKRKEESKAMKKQSRIKSSGSLMREPLGVEDSDDQSMQESLGVEDSDDQSVQDLLAVEDNDDQLVQEPLAVEGDGDQPLKQQSQLGEGLREEASKAGPYQVISKVLLIGMIKPIVSFRFRSLPTRILKAIQASIPIDLKIAEMTTSVTRVVLSYLDEITRRFDASIDIEAQLGGLLEEWINHALDERFELIMADSRRLEQNEQKNEQRRRVIEEEKRALDLKENLKEKTQKRSARPRNAATSQLSRLRN